MWDDWYEVNGKILEDKYQLQCSSRCMRSLLLTSGAAALCCWLLSFFFQRIRFLTAPLVLLTIGIAGCPLDMWEIFGVRSRACLDVVWYFLKLVNACKNALGLVWNLWANLHAHVQPVMLSLNTAYRLAQVRIYDYFLLLSKINFFG